MKAVLKLMVIIATLSASSALAGKGDLVNNGGGISEKNILFAYEKLEKFMQICLNSETCKLSGSQKDLLRKIIAGLPEEKRRAQIEFASEKNLPGYFIIDGQVRVARTGSAIGSVIIINTDLLYTKNELGGYDPISIAEGLAILIHELGHHYGNYSHEELDLVAVRVSMLLQQKIITTPLIPWTSDISVQVFNPDISSFPNVLLTVGNEVIDISKEYAATVRCTVFKVPIPILPIPDIELVTQTPAGSTLHNVHWDGIKDGNTNITVRVVGNVSNKCAQKTGSVQLNNSKLSIRFTIQKQAGAYKFLPESLNVEQFKDPWWKFIKLPR